MTNYSRSGTRCRTLCNVITAKGIIPRDRYGILRYEMTTFGRYLAFVDWDEGIRIPVPPYELEVLRQERARL